MRSRDLKPGFFLNEVLASLPPHARILFQGLWCCADREGRLEDRPLRIKAEVFPYENVDNIDELLSALEANDFIARYQVNGQRYIQIVAFAAHQHPHPREAPSVIPPMESRKKARPRQRLGNAKDIPRTCLGNAKDLPSRAGSSGSSGSSGPSGSSGDTAQEEYTRPTSSAVSAPADACASDDGSPETEPEQRREEIRAVYEHYLKAMGKSPTTYQLTPKRRAKIASRLKTWDVPALCAAVDACAADDWHMGGNGDGRVYNDLADHILRSDENVEKWVYGHHQRAKR